MNKGFTFLAAIALTSVFAASYAGAGTMQKSKKSSGGYSGPETGLLGVKLYDSGLRVITLYGNPDSITTVGGGTGVGSAGGPGAGGGGGGGAAGSPGQLPPPGGGGRGGGNRPSNDSLIPGGLVPGAWGEPVPNMQQGPLVPQNAGGSAGPGQPTNTGPSRPGGAGGASNPGGAGGSAATESAVFTRWSYTRNGCKLAFVIDKFNRVIQIEAIGLQNQRIKTRRGVGFGSSFSTVMKAYAPSADPDGYDIAGNNFTVRFLTRQRVAFRLSQLSTKKSHVVTGIVVAAGKQ